MSVPWMDDEIVPRSMTIDGKAHALEFREYSILQHEAYYNLTFRNMWDNVNDDGTIWAFTEIVLPALANSSMVVYQFYAKSNGGKSWLAIAKALQIKWLEEEHFGYEDVRLHYVFNHADISKLLRLSGRLEIPRHLRAEKGDIIICDEESFMSGSGSLNAEQALDNILSACRAKGVHFFFSDPQPSPKPNIDAWFRVCAIARKAHVTISIIEDTDGRPLGFDITTIPFENEDWKREIEKYEPLKMANIDKLLENMGYVGVDVSMEQIADAEQLLEYTLEQEESGLKITKDRLNVFASDLGIQAKGIEYCTNVVARVRMWREQDGSSKARRLDYDEGTALNWKIRDLGSTTLPEEFMERLEPWIEREIPKRAGDKGIHAEAPKWFTYYCSQGPITIQGTADHFGEQYNTVQRDIQEIRQSVFGYAIEKLIDVMHPDWVLGGGNEPVPDFETEEQIISIKGRVRKNRQIAIGDFGKAEKRKAVQEKKPLVLHMYEVKYHKEITYHSAELAQPRKATGVESVD